MDKQQMLTKIYEAIPGYEGLYTISTHGDVVSVKGGRWFTGRNRNIKASPDKQGYMTIGLCKNSIRKNYFIHRLVALTFLANPDNKPEVNHKDGDKSNNTVYNLERVTSKENSIHSYAMGLQKQPTDREKQLSVIYDVIMKGHIGDCMIGDVLDWLRDNIEELGHSNVYEHVIKLGYRTEVGSRKNPRLPIDQQSDECIKYVYDLLPPSSSNE